MRDRQREREISQVAVATCRDLHILAPAKAPYTVISSAVLYGTLQRELLPLRCAVLRLLRAQGGCVW